MKRITLLITASIFTLASIAQIRAVTEKGDTILVFENGTWKKLNETKTIKEIETTVKATVEVDAFDNTKKIRTESWFRFGENKLGNTISGYLFRVDDLTVFNISYTGDLGCLSEYSSTMKVKLDNGKVIEFSQISDTDCGDNPSARFIPLTREQMKNEDYKSILKENLEMLKNYNWVTIRINGSEYYTDIIPKITKKVTKPEQFFIQHLIAADNK